MHEKTTDKLYTLQGHGLSLIVTFIILHLKCDGLIVGGNNPIVRDGNSMSVTTKVLHHGEGAREGPFCVVVPVFVVTLINQCLKNLRILILLGLVKESQLIL
jgi:hypothetical protein